MQTPVIITVFSNQEVIYLFLSATHSLKVSEELAGTLGPAQTGGGSDRALQTFLLSSLVSLPLCLFLLLLFAVSPTLRPDYPPPSPQPPLAFSAWLQSARRPGFIMSTSLPHERTDLTQNYYLREKKYTRRGLDGASLGRVCAHARGSPPRARTERK